MDTSDESTVAAVTAAEWKRCAAIERKDREALAEVLSDDLRYMHGNGLVEGKLPLIDTLLAGGPKKASRGEFTVRTFGDVALTFGTYAIDVAPFQGQPARRVEASALQVWVVSDGRWQLEAHQATRILAEVLG